MTTVSNVTDLPEEMFQMILLNLSPKDFGNAACVNSCFLKTLHDEYFKGMHNQQWGSLLLEKGAKYPESALHIAAFHGFTEVLQMLLSRFPYYDHVLAGAAGGGNFDLLKDTLQPDIKLDLVLFQAVLHQQTESITVLLNWAQDNYDPDDLAAAIASSFKFAGEEGWANILRHFVDTAGPLLPNEALGDALAGAARFNQLEAMNYLLSLNCIDPGWAIYGAIVGCNFDLYNYLFNHLTTDPETIYTFIAEACAYLGDRVGLNWAIAQGANVTLMLFERVIEGGNSPTLLQQLCEEYEFDANDLELLLRQAVCLEDSDTRLKMIKILVDLGASLDNYDEILEGAREIDHPETLSYIESIRPE